MAEPVLLGHLGDRAVVVQTHHRGEALGGNVGRVALGDQAVGVGRIADHQHPDVGGRSAVEGLALGLEDPAVGLEQVTALHALGARARTDEEGDIDAVKGLTGIVVDVHAGEQRERAIVELHRRSLGGLDGRGNLEQRE